MQRITAVIFILVGVAHGLKINGVKEDDAPQKVLPSSLLQTSDAFAAIKDAGAALLKGDTALAKKAGKTAMLATVGTLMKGAAKAGGIHLSDDDMNTAIHKAQNSKKIHSLLDNFFTGISHDDLKKMPETVSLLQEKMSEDPHKLLGDFAKKHQELTEQRKKKHKEDRENRLKHDKEEHEKKKADKLQHAADVKAKKQENRKELDAKIKADMKAANSKPSK